MWKQETSPAWATSPNWACRATKSRASNPVDFATLGKLTALKLFKNSITRIEAGDFVGLSSLKYLELQRNQITTIESNAFAGLKLGNVILSYNSALTYLNLEGADFSELFNFEVVGDTAVTRVSLKNAVLNQYALVKLFAEPYYAIGELPGITELDISGVDFAAITDLSPLYLMDNLTDLWLADALNLDANALDTLLDNMVAMENPNVEGVLYLTQADYDAWNTAGGGKLAVWDAEPGHHVQIVPEPSVFALLATALAAIAVFRRVRWSA